MKRIGRARRRSHSQAELDACALVIDACIEMGWKHDELENGTVVLTNVRGTLSFTSYYRAWVENVQKAVLQSRLRAARQALRPHLDLKDHVTLKMLQGDYTNEYIANDIGVSVRSVQRARRRLKEV